MVRDILLYPDPLLKQKAKPVVKIDATIRALVRDMAETMYAAEGVGLAAPQVGVLRRVLVVDTSAKQEGQKLVAFVNPELATAEGRTTYNEGCLSIPGEAEDIERFAKVTVRALGLDGEPFELEADGLLAIALQHEMDHLDGVLFVDRLSSLKRGLIRKRMLKYKIEHKKGQPGEPRPESRVEL